MLNSNGVRELAYVVKIDNITPIEGYDRVELAHVGGWTIVVGKNEFHTGDLAVYFEIDSKLPEVEPFTNMEFLAKKHYKVKTQKMCKSLSQGLLMSAQNFNGEYYVDGDGTEYLHIKGKSYAEGEFLTADLGVTYAEPGDNKRKAAPADKYKRMAQRHGKLFSRQPYRWLMKRMWGKKLLFLFYGKKRDKRSSWPSYVVKTDEERVENMLWVLSDKSEWIATEKIDGTSTTFTMKRGHGFKKNEFLVCSRNVVFDKPDKKCFYETNVYTEMADKYDVETVLEFLLLAYPEAEWVTIQGETYGSGIQNRNYGLNNHEFAAFNLIMSHTGRWNSVAMYDKLIPLGIPCVPILNPQYVLPDTIDELREYVDSEASKIDGEMKEGIVFRSPDGTRSFKCVSPTYLMKYQ
ncbi:MAG: hypothetical protein IKN65_06865 [Clostridia bacterium]|nr:hypothetical protein [Clostridia bacterium]